LEELHASGCSLLTVPESLAKLPVLEYLHLGLNIIVKIFSNSMVGNNMIEKLPVTVATTSLHYLDISHNMLREIPTAIEHKALESKNKKPFQLFFEGNMLESKVTPVRITNEILN
jgi:hypothetical protein